MERLKKIEQWISFKADYFKGALVILWILWAFLQINSISMPKWETKPFDFEMEKAANQEIIASYHRIEEEAKIKGENYGPKDYFGDLIRIETEQLRIKKKYPGARNIAVGTGLTTPHLIIQEGLKTNLIRGKFTEHDITIEAQTFNEWSRGGGAYGDEFFDELGKKHGYDFLSRLRMILSWLLILYIRTVPLSFLWYLIRMCQRKGILETVLADKKKFVLAVVGWPALIWRYPFNILREIRVEAELRRLGDLFRQFGSKEREFVQKIANSEKYGQWVAEYHEKNQRKFQYGLLTALAVTILISSAVPTFASELLHQSGQSQMIVICDYHGSGSTLENDFDPVWALPEYGLETFFEKACRMFAEVESIAVQNVVRCIEHVPLCGSRAMVMGEVYPTT